MKILARTMLTLVLTLSAQADEIPDYRLPAGIVPESQTIELRLDPSQAEFSGATTIDLSIATPVERIGINQLGLQLSAIELQSAQSRRELHATDGDWERSWLADGEPIAPGGYTLKIEFSGSFGSDGLGMHRASFEGRDYVFTQMEAMYARRAFPAFDEPSFKIPYRLVINAPTGLAVVANNPAETVENNGDWQRVTFTETPPLPSYLIAFAVGPLERVAIDRMSVPGAVYAPQGHGDELGFVLRHTPTLVAALEDYFAVDYPFEKLDFIAVPDFAFGAMENPGLIAFRTDYLLVGDEVAGEQARNVLYAIAHEVAHIWYGDLVTMAWWDDLWLNEAFATWMGNTIISRVYPQFDSDLRLPQSSAFSADELTTSRPIRRVVRNEEEINDSLGLNYSKGHALLRMLERYVGAEDWRRAIRAYVERFAWSNASEPELWAVVSEVSGIDVSAIAGDYLNQPGFASIAIDDTGRVSQQRYVREGLAVDPEQWRIPLTVKYKADGELRQTQMLLDKPSGSLDIPTDADWIFPDAGGNGYFRWSISDDHFNKLIADIDELSERERIALLDNSEAMLNAGTLSMTDFLLVIDRLLQEQHPLVFLPALTKLKTLGEQFVTDDNRAAFAAYVEQLLSARYAATGIRQRADDSEAIIQMRPALVRVLGQFGNDRQQLAEAAALVERYFETPSAVQSQLALEAMRITALADDGSLYDRYIDAYLDSDSADLKSNILAAIYFDEPGIVRRHLEFSLSDAVQAGDSLSGLGYFAYILPDHAILYEWLGKNLDRVVAKAPGYYQALLPQVMAGSCRSGNLALMREFFSSRGEIYARSLEKALESEQACIDRRDRHAGEFQQFLDRYPGA